MSKYLFLLLLTLPLVLFAQSSNLDLAAEKRWHITEALADQNTFSLTKDIYSGRNHKDFSEIGWAHVRSILDSFPHMNDTRKGFYFIVLSKSFDRASGPYAESLCYEGKEYIDNNFFEFLNYFAGEGKLPLVYLEKWASIESNEVELLKENQDAKILTKLIKDYDQKCKSCHKEQKAVLKKFEDLLKKYIK